jgi:hypothetical protein
MECLQNANTAAHPTLERPVIQVAQSVVASGEPLIVTYSHKIKILRLLWEKY